MYECYKADQIIALHGGFINRISQHSGPILNISILCNGYCVSYTPSSAAITSKQIGVVIHLLDSVRNTVRILFATVSDGDTIV